MNFQRVAITGGAGFVGSSLAIALKEKWPDLDIVAFDNLIRNGSQLQVPRLLEAGVEFVKGDVRNREDLEAVDGDLLIECSAEPSVQAGLGGSPRYLLDTNLGGTIECLEWARERNASLIFLSTSRVYPIQGLENIPWEEKESRFVWQAPGEGEQRTEQGIEQDYPLSGVRSLYGTTKLSSEMLVQEYAASYGLASIINRFGVIAGPWQMGKVDQGFLALWVARHVFQGKLAYHGYGGKGKQVRDFLHIQDVVDLITLQIEHYLEDSRGEIYQAGGGLKNSTSLLELTQLCEEITSNTLEIGSVPETHPNDLRIVLLDSQKTKSKFSWEPKKSLRELVLDLSEWIQINEEVLKPILG